MGKSIFSKILGGYFLIILIVIAFLLIFSFHSIKTHYINTLTETLKNHAEYALLGVTPLFKDNKITDLQELLVKTANKTNTRLTIIDKSGKVLVDSEENPDIMDNHRSRHEIKEAFSGNTGTSLRYSNTLKKYMLYVAVPIYAGNEVKGVLRVSMFIRDIDTLIGMLKKNIMHMAIILLIVTLMISLLFSKSLSKPIKELGIMANKVASGDFSSRIFIKNKDELKTLGDNLNNMTEKISNLFNELSLQKEELKTIINSIAEGLAVFGEDGKIIMCNKALEEIFKSNTLEGKLYWEVIRDNAISNFIKQALSKKTNIINEITSDNKNYICNIVFLNARNEAIFTLHDITELKQIESVKKDFVTNVSHEMRTPLTAIKGFAETLKENARGEDAHYVDVIQKHSERLINIVNDLLVLSRLESRSFSLELSSIDIMKLIKDVAVMFDEKIKEKGLDLQIDAVSNIKPIKADPFRLEQVFINLIDNSIKYTEKGIIRIDLSQDEKNTIITIKDTGIGIPKEHLPRIFERFYVVDKSRSRKLGGTGLGLSIVKHIINLHKGGIDIESRQGSGTTFTITIPSDLS
ncbi:MAG: HAMP domain-containing protein [Endomicrobiales bacterium]|nr:HAMP domain-containing protein [Endomicrobiales bacterium]